MALIKCPECGHDVSDSAITCPNCGYGIREYYEKSQQEKVKKEIHEFRMKNVEMPNLPSKMNFCYGLAIFSAIVAILCFFNPDMWGFTAIMIPFTVWMYYEGAKKYDKELEEYNLAKSDFEKYQKEVVQKQEQRAREEAQKPKCPQCNSTNIVKISTADRAISVAMVGVASGKIGKQYKCKNCNYMW